ncbi:5-formyltetrahydrofolate cyclo-ligase [Stagnimonas aquatica]|uniref:5-formyltetrahydrofolate cyclo-ligase n=1 Tax=Stagnimonas aquatica TaxID=2689987 RepID=A0A3N0VKU7_9GAMM|nr:5-formyltetrahydrofolate cyclo-ligase [Stagnimonas aquatica]ROH93330.1 5-formyltetrahydrofolate cyclo-ligase [Stagnimonas aquatica]
MSAADPAEVKGHLRTELRARRRAIPASARRRAARRLARQYLRQRALQQARSVALYLPMASEIDTAPLRAVLAARGVALYVPKVARGKRLRFLRLGKTRMEWHHHGMPQPRGGDSLPLRRIALILLPLLGYDAQGRRLGQGGGYYDRALAGLRGARRPLRIGLAYACQQVEALPREDHDHPLQGVLSERGLQRFPFHHS